MAWGGVWRFLAFFTIAMNLFGASQLTWAALRPALSPLRVQLMSAATNYMAAGCAVYAAILQNLWDPKGLQLYADMALHYAAPILTLLFWLVATPKATLQWRDPFRWLLGPLAYVAYALTRAQFDSFYPYPFMDLPTIGWGQVALNAAGMFGFFLAVGLILIAIARTSLKRGAAPATP